MERAEPSIDPQAQEAILSSYATKGIITINEARAALGRDPYPDAAANKPMVLTGGGYVGLGQAQAGGAVAKFNHNHDERGRFATAENSGGTSTNNRAPSRIHHEEEVSDNSTSSSSSRNEQNQEALVTCEEIQNSDWDICTSVLIMEDFHYHGLCVEGMNRRYDECIAGLPLSPLLPY